MASGSYKWSAWVDQHVTLSGQSDAVILSCVKARNAPRFDPIILKLNPDIMRFEFLQDFERKFDGSTLDAIFSKAGKDRVSVPELIRIAEVNKLCSEETLRKLIRATDQYEVDKKGKTHYVSRKPPVEF